MKYRQDGRFEYFLRQQPYRNVFNWPELEKLAGLPAGRIALVVENKEDFTEAENEKLYRFFSEMASECLPIPSFVSG
jgi:hypothetical protein